MRNALQELEDTDRGQQTSTRPRRREEKAPQDAALLSLIKIQFEARLEDESVELDQRL